MNAVSRVYVFTLNNYSEDDVTRIAGWLNDANVLDAVVGREVASTGCRHLQGYCRMRKPIRFRAMLEFVGARAHLEVCKSPDDAVIYCRKDGNMVVDKKTPSQKGHRSDLDEAREAMDEGGMAQLRLQCPNTLIRFPAGCRLYLSLAPPPTERRVSVFLYYSAETGTGKTHAAHLNPPHYRVMLPASKSTPPWFENYQGEPHLIIDEYDGQFDYRFFLSLLDSFPLLLPAKGASVAARFTRITITSNILPQLWYPDKPYPHLERRLLTGGIFNSAPWGLGDLWIPRVQPRAERVNPIDIEPMCN